MRKALHTAKIALLVFLCASSGLQDPKPDVLELDSGRILKGRFESADEDNIKFRTAKGVLDVPRATCVRLHFARTDDPGAAEGQGNPRAQAEAERRRQQKKQNQGQQQPRKELQIPAGTPIPVAMEIQISGDDPPGGFISASVTSNVKAGGQVAIPQGSRVFGRVVETGEVIRLEFTEVNIWGETYKIHSTAQASPTASRMNAGQAGTAAGAVIGQRIDGSSGWNSGAWVGAFVGRAVGENMQSYETVIETGSIVEFRLSRPLRVKK